MRFEKIPALKARASWGHHFPKTVACSGALRLVTVNGRLGIYRDMSMIVDPASPYFDDEVMDIWERLIAA